MDDEISGWALQVAVEILGYENIGDIPDKELKEVYQLAEEMDD